MKYVILVGDGMGDYPVPELGGKTPLEAAATPHLDELARRGELGCARTIPPGKEPGSDIANLAIMGYDPVRYHTGRAPLEAAALGVDLAPEEVAFRCNLVTLRHEDSQLFMEDYSAGHITSDEAKELIAVLEAALGRDGRRFYPGVSYRHLLVWTEGDAAWRTYPPHDWTGQEVGHLMTGEAQPLWDLIRASWPVLAGRPVNRRRMAAGKKPATSIWLWGQGRSPQMPTLQERFGLSRRGDFRGGPHPGHRQVCRAYAHPRPRGHGLSGHQLRRQGGRGPGRLEGDGSGLRPRGGPG